MKPLLWPYWVLLFAYLLLSLTFFHCPMSLIAHLSDMPTILGFGKHMTLSTSPDKAVLSARVANHQA